ncbi:MAG: flagellar hook protein FlgE [Lachnospiraceae bacterium]|nr:flagellar hook protein FlgE [Lachnospiraceae bacterium]
MMRSMFSGVAGLKTHQTKMDVIGNNIANVNTTAYKSSSINFSELLYQTTSRASGPNALTGRAGVNAKQIGLGVQSAAISNAITTGGATQNTGNPFDIKINGEAFFVVSDGKSNYFTRDGSFYVDAAGNLAMSANGYNVMGWGVDEATQTIKKDTVQALRIMSAANMTYPPEATTEAYVDGILDKNEPDASTESGKTMNLSFFDALGYSYTAKFAVRETTAKGEYMVELADILDSTGTSLKDVYKVNDISEIASFGGSRIVETTELRKLISDVVYTRDPGTDRSKDIYSRKMALEEVFSDYKEKGISGLKYRPVTIAADGTETPTIADGDAFAPGGTVTMTGTGTLSRSDMETLHKLIFVEATTDAAGNAVPAHYYYEKADGTAVTLDSTSTPADWADVLGIPAAELKSVTLNGDGSVEFNHETSFTYGETGSYSGGNFTVQISRDEAYGLDTSKDNVNYTFVVAEDGQAQVTTSTTYNGHQLIFNTDTGKFVSISGGDSVTLDFETSVNTLLGTSESLANFSDINIDWTNVTWFDNGGASTMTAQSGTEGKGLGSGRKLGNMSGVSIQNNGEIYATYDNGMTKLVGQIAVAKFANAAGLEKAGDNLYQATLNSGEFDGIGVDITADGAGSMTTGALEMSNVDLSSEFTHMITTQRGFQANSRIITVSDTLLEELVNLKR